jgi:ADP-dependent NAD(P)H-hydrate dehydratase
MTITEVTPEFLRKMPLPDPEEGDKQARGNVLVIAGGRDVPGGALLAGVGALRAGAGRLQIATCARNATALAISVPEALVLGLRETPDGGIDPTGVEELAPFLESADVVLIGPGMQHQDAVAELSAEVLDKVASGPALVFDARAIKDLYSARRLLERHQGRVVITPHAGEMAGLVGLERSQVESDAVDVARRVAADLKVVVALKGARTIIAGPLDQQVVCRKGNVGLATSGSGDVLAGVITGLLGRGAPVFVGACWGVYLHAKAGDRLSKTVGPLGYLAHELLPEIPRILATLS